MAVPRIRPVSVLLGALAALFVWLMLGSVAHAAEGVGAGPAQTELSWHAVHFICSLIIGIYTWVSSTQKADREKVNAVEKQVAKLEEKFAALWTSQQLTELTTELRGNQEKVSALTDEMRKMSTRFERYETHMLTRGA